jgi:hypothetical protein
MANEGRQLFKAALQRSVAAFMPAAVAGSRKPCVQGEIAARPSLGARVLKDRSVARYGLPSRLATGRA